MFFHQVHSLTLFPQTYVPYISGRLFFQFLEMQSEFSRYTHHVKPPFMFEGKDVRWFTESDPGVCLKYMLVFQRKWTAVFTRLTRCMLSFLRFPSRLVSFVWTRWSRPSGSSWSRATSVLSSPWWWVLLHSPSFRAASGLGDRSLCKWHSIQFKFICIAPFTIQSLQSSFTGN